MTLTTLVDNKVQGRLFTMNVKKCLKRQLLVVSNFERSPELLLEIKKKLLFVFLFQQMNYKNYLYPRIRSFRLDGSDRFRNLSLNDKNI